MDHKELALNTAAKLATELNKPHLVDEVQNVFDERLEEFKADEAYEKETVIVLFFNLLVNITGQGFEIYKHYNSKQQPLPPKEQYCEQILEELDRKEIKYNSEDAKIIGEKTVDTIYESSQSQEL